MQSAKSPFNPIKGTCAQAFVLFQAHVWSFEESPFDDATWNAINIFKGRTFRPTQRQLESGVADPGDIIISFDDRSHAKISSEGVSLMEEG